MSARVRHANPFGTNLAGLILLKSATRLLGFIGTAATAGAAAAETANSYDYPTNQPGYAHIAATDPDRRVLTDGVMDRTDGPGAVWGPWDVSDFIVDWTFSEAVRVQGIDVTQLHIDENPAHRSHVGRVTLTGSDGPSGFLVDPDFTADIPYQSGRIQSAHLSIPGNGLVVRRLRTNLISTEHQSVVMEVRFTTTPANAEDLAAAQATRADKQLPVLASIPVPAPPANTTPLPLRPSIFGFSGHVLHTDLFYPGKFTPYWRPEFTLPLLRSGRFGWVREPLYQTMNFFVGEDPAAVTRNRARIETYLADCQRAGVRVILCPMFCSLEDPVHGHNVAPFFEWVGGLAKTHPGVGAIELHNEPNLPTFWGGGVTQFVATARAGAAILKRISPKTPVVGGSVSSLWWDPGVAWMEDSLRLGMLDFVDGVSVHPYRCGMAPEGDPHRGTATDPRGTEQALADWWRLVQRYNRTGKPLKLFLTEVGYSSATRGLQAVGTVERQADYLTRLMLIMTDLRLRGLPIEALCWYNLKCDGPGESDEDNFGLVSADTTVIRPGFLAYRRLAEAVADVSTLAPDDRPLTFGNWPDVIKHYAWRRKTDGALLVAFWRLNQRQGQDVDFNSDLRLPVAAGTKVRSVTLHDLHEDRPRALGFTQKAASLHIPLRVTSRAAWIVVEF